MRDPEGAIEFQGRQVIRRIHPNATSKSFLQSTFAANLVTAGQLIPYEFTAPDKVESPRLPFISYPFEWCDAQLYLAAQLTLDISRAALKAEHELKDASAWNVIFQGNRPVFCDHLSFQPIVMPQWWAFGQFVRNFLLPIVVSQQCGLKPHQIYSVYHDGIPPDVARNILGLKRYLTRYWPLMVASDKKSQSDPPPKKANPLHDSLYEFCQSMLNGGRPVNDKGHWADYTELRRHYTEEAQLNKFQKVGEWLEVTKSTWIVDLGCNTGEFTLLSAKTGADVIAVDLDHNSIQKLVLSQTNASKIYPLIANLGDMVGGRGWCGDEFPSLMTRLYQQADMLLMLALIHHLAISEGIHVKKIAQMAANITREFLIVEMLDETDPMVLHLCSQRKRESKDFSMAEQVAAFNQYFSIIVNYPIPNTLRTLCLLKKK